MGLLTNIALSLVILFLVVPPILLLGVALIECIRESLK
jgi:hypothetical protein